jgi:hypothetical protein
MRSGDVLPCAGSGEHGFAKCHIAGCRVHFVLTALAIRVQLSHTPLNIRGDAVEFINQSRDLGQTALASLRAGRVADVDRLVLLPCAGERS